MECIWVSGREDCSFPRRPDLETRHSPLQQVSSVDKRERNEFILGCVLTVKHIWVLYRNSGYFIYNLGLWIPMRLCGKQLCPVSGILCPSTQACSIRHAALNGLCPQDCALQICRYLCTYWHWDIFACSHKFASEWQQLQSQQEKLQVNRIHGWSPLSGLRSSFNALPLCTEGTAGRLSTGDSSLAALGSLYLMGEGQSSSPNSPSPEVRKGRVCQSAKAIWFLEWKPSRRVSIQAD